MANCDMRPLLLLVLCSCSAVISPDPDLLGGSGFDGGPSADVQRVDAGPGNDSGPFDAGTDSARPPIDAGPGCEGRPPRCDENDFVTCVDGVDVSQPCLESQMCDVDFGGCRGINECPGAPDMCRADMSLRCAGDETYTTFPCENGCDATTGLCTERRRFVPSNLGVDAFQDDAMDLALPAGRFTVDTDSCNVTSGVAQRAQMNSGDFACVWTVGDMEMPASTYLQVFGQLPLIIVAAGDVSIEGTFDLSAEGNIPGAGGYSGGALGQPNGMGDNGGLVGARQEPYGDGGGGGGGGLSEGGRGGDAGNGPARGGQGGSELRSSGEPLAGGSGGGMGPGFPGREGNGGGGGGAIQITALGTLNFQGTIHASGGAGAGGTSSTNESNWGAGGGGGAGGLILLEAWRVEMQGTLSVSGGSGGAGPSNTSNGNNDGEGGPVFGVAHGGRPGTRGGDGGDDTPRDGDSTKRETGNGGGGGGSAGLVIVRGENISVEGNLNPNVPPARLPL